MMFNINRTLNSAGKTNFVDCFEARQNSSFDLKESEIERLCQPRSRDWVPRSLTTIKNAINRIFRENRQCEALQICCDAEKLPCKETRPKARKLYKKFCECRNRARS